VPPSVFRGRVPTAGEPLWGDDDRDHAMALLALEADTCSCGEPMSQSTATTADGEYAAEAVVCHACAASARAVRRLGDSPKSRDGVMTRIVRRPKGT